MKKEQCYNFEGFSVEWAINAAKRDKRLSWREIIEEAEANSAVTE